MRRLATALDIEAASLYAHVASKDDLVDAVLDMVLDEVVLPEPSPDARAGLVAAFGSYLRTLIAHPRVVMLMLERAHRSAAQARLVTRSIELLESMGLSPRAAVDAHVTLVAYVLGFIVQEVGRPTATPAPVAAASPTLAKALSMLAERTVDARFTVGLEIILNGVHQSAQPGADIAGLRRHAAGLGEPVRGEQRLDAACRATTHPGPAHRASYAGRHA